MAGKIINRRLFSFGLLGGLIGKTALAWRNTPADQAVGAPPAGPANAQGAAAGYMPPGPKALLRAVGDKLAENRSLLDNIPHQRRAAIIAGTSTWDGAAAQIQALIDDAAGYAGAVGGNTLRVPKGLYPLAEQITHGNLLTLIGESNRGSILKALPEFPPDTAVLRIGDGSELRFNTVVQNLGIDCSSVAGSRALEMTQVNEGCAAVDCLFQGFATYGIHVKSAIVGASLRNCEIYSSATASNATTQGVRIELAGNLQIDGVTVIGLNKKQLMADGFFFRNAVVNGGRLHGERCRRVVNGSNGSSGVLSVVTASASAPDVDTVVHFDGGTNAWKVSNVVKGFAKNTLVDDLYGLTIRDPVLGDYDQSACYIGFAKDMVGYGSPEGTVSAYPGSLFRSYTDGLYAKLSGKGTPTGWRKLTYAEGAAISAPAGGPVIDAQARDAIRSLIDRLQKAGIISS